MALLGAISGKGILGSIATLAVGSAVSSLLIPGQAPAPQQALPVAVPIPEEIEPAGVSAEEVQKAEAAKQRDIRRVQGLRNQRSFSSILQQAEEEPTKVKTLLGK